MNSIQRLLFALCSLISTATWAGQFHQSTSYSHRHLFKDASVELGHWYVGAGSGIAVPHTNTNTYGYAPAGSGMPSDQYVRNNTQNEPLISVLGGYRFINKQEWFPFYSIGAEYTYVFNSKLNGVINQFSNPAFQNYNYQYEIQRQTVLAVFKVDIYKWEMILPYVTLGAGFSRNSVSNYSEQAVPGVTPRVSPGYSAKASVYGSWMLGGGLDLAFTDNIWGNLEYNYGYYGDAQTGNGSTNSGTPGNNFSNSNLTTKLNASTFAANIIYYFNL